MLYLSNRPAIMLLFIFLDTASSEVASAWKRKSDVQTVIDWS